MNILAITQARVGSTRLPAKILKDVQGISLLEIHLKRVLQSKCITKLKVATTIESGSTAIISIAQKMGVETYQGSIDNVLDRFYHTAKPENPDFVVRLTSDCPLIDPEIIDRVIEIGIESGCDYVSNTLSPTFPDGMDVEFFKFSALEKAYMEAQLISDKEHVTPYIWRNSTFKGGVLFQSKNVESTSDYSAFRITVDTLDDFLLVENLITHVGIEKSCYDYIQYLKANASVVKLNQHFTRNEGYDNSLLKD